jgi:hypothetical protein
METFCKMNADQVTLSRLSLKEVPKNVWFEIILAFDRGYEAAKNLYRISRLQASSRLYYTTLYEHNYGIMIRIYDKCVLRIKPSHKVLPPRWILICGRER